MPILDENRLLAEIERHILALLAQRAEAASICPSEVARAVALQSGFDWRRLMPKVRSVAVQMALARRIRITRKGQPLNPRALGAGPIRLSRDNNFQP